MLTAWPKEYHSRAEHLLLTELSSLSCELLAYINLDLSRKTVYTHEISNLYYRIGRAGLYAEVVQNTTVQQILDRLRVSLEIIRDNLDYSRALDDVYFTRNNLIGIIADMKNRHVDYNTK